MEGKESQVQPKIGLAVKFKFKTRPIKFYHNSRIFNIIYIIIQTNVFIFFLIQYLSMICLWKKKHTIIRHRQYDVINLIAIIIT